MNRVILTILSIFFTQAVIAEEEVASKYIVVFCKVSYFTGAQPSISHYRTSVIETKQQFKEFERIRFSHNWAGFILRDLFKKKFKSAALEIEGKIFDDARKARDYYRKEGRGKYKFKMSSKDFDSAYNKWAAERQ